MNAQQLLQAYLSSEDSAADMQREALARSIRTLVRKSVGKREIVDLEDLEEECVLTIWSRVSALKSGAVTGAIENLEAFVRQAVHNRYCDAIRRKRPKWYNLKLELLELFSGRAGVRGFALWQTPDSSGRLLGFDEWRGRRGSGTTKCRQLADDSASFRRKHLQNRDPGELPVHELAAAVLDYCGGPVDVDVMTSALADLLQARREEPLSIDAQPDPDGDAGAPVEWLISPDAPVEEQVVNASWFANVIDWFWKEFTQLTLKQRKALIYGMASDQVIALAGIVGFDDVAKSIQIGPEAFAELTQSLPLPDLVTAEELGVETRAVPSIRFKAWSRIRRRTRKSALSLAED